MNTLVTNQLVKGDKVILANGWKAKIEDNKKGNIRLATVYGRYEEVGSIYAHDIKGKIESDGSITVVVPTAAQQKLRQRVNNLF